MSEEGGSFIKELRVAKEKAQATPTAHSEHAQKLQLLEKELEAMEEVGEEIDDKDLNVSIKPATSEEVNDKLKLARNTQDLEELLFGGGNK